MGDMRAGGKDSRYVYEAGIGFLRNNCSMTLKRMLLPPLSVTRGLSRDKRFNGKVKSPPPGPKPSVRKLRPSVFQRSTSSSWDSEAFPRPPFSAVGGARKVTWKIYADSEGGKSSPTFGGCKELGSSSNKKTKKTTTTTKVHSMDSTKRVG